VSAAKRFRAWPVWLRVPAIAAVGVSALGLGWVLGDLVPGGRDDTVRPITALATTTSGLAVAEPGVAAGGTASTATTIVGAAATAPLNTTTTVASSARVSDATLVRVICDAVGLEIVGRVLTTTEAGDAVRAYQTAPDPAPGVDPFCRSWVRDHLPTDSGKSGTPNIVSSTN
jgi:hypothetical protein